MQYFYSGQTRAYILQFIRLFGSFTVQKGFDDKGDPVYERVPARYGDMNRQVGHVIRENSENMLNAVPFISCYVNSFEMNPDLRRYPQFAETLQVIEKKYDYDTKTYADEPGRSYNVTRYQPVPYTLTMDVDIWTSNTDQKLQLLEQILVLFNPSVNLYTNDNPLDWTRLTYCELKSTNWSSRSQPQGADNVIDVAKLTFDMPVFISPPAQVQRMNIINTILAQVHTLDVGELDAWTVDEDERTGDNFVITTLENYWVRLNADHEAILLLDGGREDDGLSWKNDVFSNYGGLRPGISQLRFRSGMDITDESKDIIGTIDYHEDANKLIVDIDDATLPLDTDGMIDDIIDPQSMTSSDIPNTPFGRESDPLKMLDTTKRYLLLSELSEDGNMNEVLASENDIIRYDGSAWVIDFDASETEGSRYVSHVSTGAKYEWNGDFWQNALEGTYRQGWARLYI